MKRQGQRTDLTFSPTDKKLRSGESLAEEVGDSQPQIYRFIRLTNLIPELLDLVDEGRIALRPAVEISFLPDKFQYDLLNEIEIEQCTPSHAQALKMRRMNDEGKLSEDVITSIMLEEKPNQKERFALRADKVNKLLPKDLEPKHREEYILTALEFYAKHKEKQRNRNLER